jgi:hypothetical protein
LTVKDLMMTNASMEPVQEQVDEQVQVLGGGSRRRRRRGAKPPSEGGNTESLWANAFDVDLSSGAIIQLVGLSSPTRTVFARILKSINKESRECQNQADEYLSLSTSFGQVVELVLDKARHVHAATPDYETKAKTSFSSVPLVHSASDLLELGSVWLLGEQQPESAKNTRRGTNQRGRSSWRRLAPKELDRAPENWSCLTLRVHCRPARFSTSWKVDNAIVHQVSS